MTLPAAVNDASFSSQRARSVPVLSSMSTIRGYPSKLKVFRIRGSRYWQMRCYVAGRMVVRSTRSQAKQQAIEIAKHFYDELLLKHRHVSHDESNHDVDEVQQRYRLQLRHAEHVAQHAGMMFRVVAERTIDAERGRMMRGELAMQSFKALRNRLQKQICPVLGKLDIRRVSYNDL